MAVMFMAAVTSANNFNKLLWLANLLRLNFPIYYHTWIEAPQCCFWQAASRVPLGYCWIDSLKLWCGIIIWWSIGAMVESASVGSWWSSGVEQIVSLLFMNQSLDSLQMCLVKAWEFLNHILILLATAFFFWRNRCVSKELPWLCGFCANIWLVVSARHSMFTSKAGEWGPGADRTVIHLSIGKHLSEIGWDPFLPETRILYAMNVKLYTMLVIRHWSLFAKFVCIPMTGWRNMC